MSQTTKQQQSKLLDKKYLIPDRLTLFLAVSSHEKTLAIVGLAGLTLSDWDDVSRFQHKKQRVRGELEIQTESETKLAAHGNFQGLQRKK